MFAYLQGQLREWIARSIELGAALFGATRSVASAREEQMIGLLQKQFGLDAIDARREYDKLKDECHCV
ncbi:MAG: hypothetical protein QM811_26820 [Pirellulales bacterium]